MNLLAAPALPLHQAGSYVVAAYIVFLLLVIAYVAIIALRTRRTERALQELQREVLERGQKGEAEQLPTPGAPQPDTEKEPVL